MSKENTGSPVIALHISIPVIDMQEALHFYHAILGLTIVESSEDLSQLYFSEHRISLKKTSVDSPSIQRDSIGGVRSRHFGFRVRDKDTLKVLEDKFLKSGVQVILPLTERAIDYTVFVLDPSGNQVEIYCEKNSHD